MPKEKKQCKNCKDAGWVACCNLSEVWHNPYYRQGYEAGRAVERERIVGNVGVLRQLLNEERLPADKMIDNGYIERCLELSALSNDPTGEE